MRLRIDMACNDPENGVFTGLVEAIHVPIFDLELESYGGPRRLVERKRRRDPPRRDGLDHHGQHVRCWELVWNGYWMEAATVARFLTWLHKRNLFDCTAGEAEFHDRWQQRTLMQESAVEQRLRQAALDQPIR